MTGSAPPSCLCCGRSPVRRAFRAPEDQWSRAIGWHEGATYHHCATCTGLTLAPRMADAEHRRFYEHLQRTEATGFSDDGVPEFHLEHKAVTAELKWGFFEQLGLAAALGPARSVYEIGAAEGTLLATFRDRGHQVAGIEPFDRYAEHARTVLDLDVATGYFGADTILDPPPNLIVVDNVLEHVPDPRALLGQVRAALAPDGLLLVLVPMAEVPEVSNANVAHNTLWSRRSLHLALDAAGFAVLGSMPGRPARRPHEWVALARVRSDGAEAPGDGALPDGPSRAAIRRTWLPAIHGPALKARGRRTLGPVYRLGARITRPVRTRG